MHVLVFDFSKPQAPIQDWACCVCGMVLCILRNLPRQPSCSTNIKVQVFDLAVVGKDFNYVTFDVVVYIVETVLTQYLVCIRICLFVQQPFPRFQPTFHFVD